MAEKKQNKQGGGEGGGGHTFLKTPLEVFIFLL